MVHRYQIYRDPKEGKYSRILEVDNDNNVCYLVKVTNKGEYFSGPHTIGFNEIEKQIPNYILEKKDPISRIFADDELSDSVKELRDKRYNLIKSIISKKPLCYSKTWVSKEISKLIKLVKEKAEQIRKEGNNEIAKNLLKDHTRYKYNSAYRAYLASGERKNGLISKHSNCGGAGKQRKPKNGNLGRRPLEPSSDRYILTDDDKIKLKNGWKEFGDKKMGYGSIVSAFNQTLTKHYHNAVVHPSKMQFKRWGKILNNATESKRDKVGDINFNKDHRALTSNARNDAFGPGVEAQLDATKDDTHALSIVIENTYIGRLTLFIIVDSCTSMPLGIALVPDNASYHSACMVLINAATDKVKFCKSLDIDINHDDWPCKGLPAKILSDLGLLFGPLSSSVIDNLRIQVDNTESMRPEFKPIVERHIGKLLQKIKHLLFNKGLVNKKDSPRTITDTRTQATLHYKEILKIMVLEILFFIKYEPIENYPIPLEMDLQGIEATSLNLWHFFASKISPTITEEDPIELTVKLLPTEQCKYDRTGILFQRRRWQCETSEGLVEFNNLLHGGGPKYLRIGYNRGDKNEVYLVLKDQYFRLYPIRNDINVHTFYELDFNDRIRGAVKRINNPDKNKAVILKESAQQKIINDATKRKNKAGKTDIKNVTVAKEADKNHYYAEQPKKSNGAQSKSNTESVSQKYTMPDF